MHNIGVINNYNSQHELNEPLLVLEFKNYKCAKYFFYSLQLFIVLSERRVSLKKALCNYGPPDTD